MIEVSEALAMVLARVQPKPAARRPIESALGLTLATDVASDIDSPPHDKSLVDGYAIRAADLANVQTELRVLEEVTAGAVPAHTVLQGTATRIMTGAPIPSGADAVVMVEQTELVEGEQGECVRIRHGDSPKSRTMAGQHIMRRASSLARGEVVLQAGHVIRPIEIGLLAEVGQHEVDVVDRPSLAVIATGDELVPHGQVPAAGQIRNSNGPMLAALASRLGYSVTDLGIARDQRSTLRERIEAALDHDVVLLSGGVSAGVLDLVPGVLEELNVHQVFHKVNLKPGKPLWFGVLKREQHDTLVFGLPGNPVSGLVCFELFVRPALGKLAGKSSSEMPRGQARLTDPHPQRGDRPTYWPARLNVRAEPWTVQPLTWRGSADLRTLTDASGLAFFPAGERQFLAGESINVFLFDT